MTSINTWWVHRDNIFLCVPSVFPTTKAKGADTHVHIYKYICMTGHCIFIWVFQRCRPHFQAFLPHPQNQKWPILKNKVLTGKLGEKTKYIEHHDKIRRWIHYWHHFFYTEEASICCKTPFVCFLRHDSYAGQRLGLASTAALTSKRETERDGGGEGLQTCAPSAADHTEGKLLRAQPGWGGHTSLLGCTVVNQALWGSVKSPVFHAPCFGGLFIYLFPPHC